MRFVLAAEEAMGARALKILSESSHTIVALMTDEKLRRSVCQAPGEIAKTKGIPIWPAKLLKDPATADLLRTHDVDILLNVYSTHRVCADVLGAVGSASLNLHPGPLPEVAGRNPIGAALYHGHSEHGVTLHHMQVEFDAGAIAYETRFPIEERDTAGSLSFRCAREGETLLTALFKDASVGAYAIPRARQDISKRVYFSGKMPRNGEIDWSCPARDVWNFVRAYDFLPFSSPWGHPSTILGGRRVGIARSLLTSDQCDQPPGTVRLAKETSVLVAAGDQWLKVEKVVLDGVVEPAAHILHLGARFGN